MGLKRIAGSIITVGVMCSMLQSVPGEGAVDFAVLWRRLFPGGPSDKALSIGSTEFLHLGAIRGIITLMDTPCQKVTVNNKSQYIPQLSPDTRKILYSFTHGRVTIDDYDGYQHIFKGLALTGWFEQYVPDEKFVPPEDLPDNLSFELVFINACHAGDVAEGYSGSQSAAFREKFGSNAVYIAPRGGRSTVLINPTNPFSTCTTCTPMGVAEDFAVDFFNKIKTERAAEHDRTFEWIMEATSNNDKYIIYNGETSISTVFPFPQ